MNLENRVVIYVQVLDGKSFYTKILNSEYVAIKIKDNYMTIFPLEILYPKSINYFH